MSDEPIDRETLVRKHDRQLVVIFFVGILMGIEATVLGLWWAVLLGYLK